MLNATATREEALHDARRTAWGLVEHKTQEPDGKVAAEPTDHEVEQIRFLVNGLADVRCAV